ncbi:arylamine N-acetyltransferase [Kitasatospora sp. NPDC101801]|uniref:arylamine N-acetyltransferase family protein n=1 Tax=Kitasatospora sp. NPDC101801 TaxID=3364103 RepID=UPI00380DA232
MLTDEMVDGYLRRLGVARPGRPTVEGLFALHRAQVERVPYETLEIQLGRPTTIEPVESVRRILAGRGGYCFHLNGAFAALLTALGYRVTWHVGGVQNDPTVPAGANANHLALTVECEQRLWFADAGLGEALHEPLPLAEGTYRQGPFTFGLLPSAAEPGGWRFEHDPRGAFPGMDFRPEPAGPADFRERHSWLSTAPDSPFARVACALRRDAGGSDGLRGLVLVRTDAAGRSERELLEPADWFAALADVFGLTLTDLTRADRDRLWRKVHAAHLIRAAERAVAAGPVSG